METFAGEFSVRKIYEGLFGGILGSSPSSGQTLTLILLTICAGSAGAAFILLQRRKVRSRLAKEARLRPAQPQRPLRSVCTNRGGGNIDEAVGEADGGGRVPGGSSPIFTGIRVLEWATHIAAPTVGRCLADLGRYHMMGISISNV